jgi:hypothetical protein
MQAEGDAFQMGNILGQCLADRFLDELGWLFLVQLQDTDEFAHRLVLGLALA